MSRFSSVPYPARAIVLRTRNLGEKDRIMTLLSAEAGKFSAVARGARAPKSKLAAVSQPFTLARFLVTRGRSLDIATQAEVERAHTHIAGDLLHTAWAAYLCELCDIVPERQPDEALFELLRVALEALDQAGERDQADAAGLWFEARFLALLGYAPTIGRCVACGEKIVVPPNDDSRRIAFSPSLGGTLCAACQSRDPQRLTAPAQSLRALHSLSRAASPEAFDVSSLTTLARRELRACLHRSLVVHLEVRLRSRKFLDEVLSAAPCASLPAAAPAAVPLAATSAPPDAL